MEKLTEVYNTVRKHLLEQNEKSKLNPALHFCMYRGADGRKCAIGVLIKDEYYNSDLESKPINFDKPMAAVLLSLGEEVVWDMQADRFRIYCAGLKLTKYQKNLQRMLVYLQQTHDNAPVEHWRAHLPEDLLELIKVESFRLVW